MDRQVKSATNPNEFILLQQTEALREEIKKTEKSQKIEYKYSGRFREKCQYEKFAEKYATFIVYRVLRNLPDDIRRQFTAFSLQTDFEFTFFVYLAHKNGELQALCTKLAKFAEDNSIINIEFKDTDFHILGGEKETNSGFTNCTVELANKVADKLFVSLKKPDATKGATNATEAIDAVRKLTALVHHTGHDEANTELLLQLLTTLMNTHDNNMAEILKRLPKDKPPEASAGAVATPADTTHKFQLGTGPNLQPPP